MSLARQLADLIADLDLQVVDSEEEVVASQVFS